MSPSNIWRTGASYGKQQLLMKRLFCLLLAAAMLSGASAQSNGLDSIVNAYAAEHRFSGSILVQQDSAVVYSGAFGLANIPYSIANRLDTRFRVASITKLFTAVLVLQLYEQGKLDLDSTIQTYLPDYDGEAAQRVTVHQLLNHTSGMLNPDSQPDPEFGHNWLELYGKPYTIDQLMAKFCRGKLVNEPGTVFDYNNTEYIMLGRIIEAITKKPFEAVLHEQILDPLGMSASGMYRSTQITPVVADTYSRIPDTDVLEKDMPIYIENWYAAGAMYANAPDLLTFVNRLFDYKLLEKETVKRLVTPGLDDYGYGVWVRGAEHPAMERYGRILGANTVVLRFLNSDLTVIILGNTDRINNLGPFAYLIAEQFGI